MIKRTLMVIGALMGLIAVAAPVANAGAPGGTTLTANAAAYRPGDTATLTASGFTACVGQPVTFTFMPPGNDPDVVLSAVANASGVAVMFFNVPNRPGRWDVDATSPGCTPATTSFVVNRPVYPPGRPTVGTDSSAYKPGETATITANTCASVLVTFTITPPGGGTPIVLTATSSAAGVASVTFTVPDTLGTYQVAASAPGCETAFTSFVVRNLPAAGSDPSSWLTTGGIAVLSGAGLVLVAWRRRRPAPAVA